MSGIPTIGAGRTYSAVIAASSNVARTSAVAAGVASRSDRGARPREGADGEPVPDRRGRGVRRRRGASVRRPIWRVDQREESS